MNDNAMARIKENSVSHSTIFDVEESLKQGGGLSAILYGQHIGAVIEGLEKEKLGPKVGNIHVPALAWQDDVTLLPKDLVEEGQVEKGESWESGESGESTNVTFPTFPTFPTIPFFEFYMRICRKQGKGESWESRESENIIFPAFPTFTTFSFFNIEIRDFSQWSRLIYYRRYFKLRSWN